MRTSATELLVDLFGFVVLDHENDRFVRAPTEAGVEFGGNSHGPSNEPRPVNALSLHSGLP